MMSTTSIRRAVLAAGLATGVLGVAGCASVTPATVVDAHIRFIPADNPGFKINKDRLLHPKHKYFGISLAGVPQSVTTPITQIKQETGKRPNLAMYYLSWGNAADAKAGDPNFDPTAAENSCAAGMLPMLTWQSWDTALTTPGEGVSYTQPAYNMKNIIGGQYDAYIKKTAEAIASIGCPIAVRFDQEQNGYWYPWGISNTDENGTDVNATAQEFVQMWRHVHRIFTAAHATNVLWVWSPNIQGAKPKVLPPMLASYPGPKWVDWVGVDGYLSHPFSTFANTLGPTLKQLDSVAPRKPWIISETAVGETGHKASQIKNLLDSIAKDKRLNGIVWFEQHKASDRSNWMFTDSSAALNAFKKGIDQTVYASGKPGDSWYTR